MLRFKLSSLGNDLIGLFNADPRSATKLDECYNADVMPSPSSFPPTHSTPCGTQRCARLSRVEEEAAPLTTVDTARMEPCVQACTHISRVAGVDFTDPHNRLSSATTHLHNDHVVDARKSRTTTSRTSTQTPQITLQKSLTDRTTQHGARWNLAPPLEAPRAPTNGSWQHPAHRAQPQGLGRDPAQASWTDRTWRHAPQAPRARRSLSYPQHFRHTDMGGKEHSTTGTSQSSAPRGSTDGSTAQRTASLATRHGGNLTAHLSRIACLWRRCPGRRTDSSAVATDRGPADVCGSATSCVAFPCHGVVLNVTLTQKGREIRETTLDGVGVHVTHHQSKLRKSGKRLTAESAGVQPSSKQITNGRL